MSSMIKGIIFDMDNTLLRSTIDFAGMKRDTYRFLCSHGVLPHDLDLTVHTTSTLIEQAMASGRMTDSMVQRMWEIPTRYEREGMQNADLESGAAELLDSLQSEYRLVVVTNNSIAAAEIALRTNGIYDMFDYVVGREMMGALKPAPDGFHYVLQKYPHWTAEDWISVGDSWVDAKASSLVGIPFILYQGDLDSVLRAGVRPRAHIQQLHELKKTEFFPQKE